MNLKIIFGTLSAGVFVVGSQLGTNSSVEVNNEDPIIQEESEVTKYIGYDDVLYDTYIEAAETFVDDIEEGYKYFDKYYTPDDKETFIIDAIDNIKTTEKYYIGEIDDGYEKYNDFDSFYRSIKYDVGINVNNNFVRYSSIVDNVTKHISNYKIEREYDVLFHKPAEERFIVSCIQTPMDCYPVWGTRYHTWKPSSNIVMGWDYADWRILSEAGYNGAITIGIDPTVSDHIVENLESSDNCSYMNLSFSYKDGRTKKCDEWEFRDRVKVHILQYNGNRYYAKTETELLNKVIDDVVSKGTWGFMIDGTNEFIEGNLSASKEIIKDKYLRLHYNSVLTQNTYTDVNMLRTHINQTITYDFKKYINSYILRLKNGDEFEATSKEQIEVIKQTLIPVVTTKIKNDV